MFRLARLSTSLATRLTFPQSSPIRTSVPNRPSLLLYASTFATASFFQTPTLLAEARPIATAPSHAPEIVLYQYEVCPFCNKVRAWLDYHGVKYSVIEVDPLRKTELSGLEDQTYRKVPIALVDGKQINGSNAVIEAVGSAIGELGSIPESMSEKERQWMGWLDDTLIHLIAPNIYRTAGESLQTFEYIAENAKFSSWQRTSIKYSGAAAMYFVGKKLKKKYEIGDERQEIKDALKDWISAVKGEKGDFLGGGQPGVVDLSVYGVLKAISTFDTFNEVVAQNDELHDWFNKVKDAVGDTALVSRE